MKYQLKNGRPPFEVVDGPMAGHLFKPGEQYTHIPTAERSRFDKVKPPAKAGEDDKK